MGYLNLHVSVYVFLCMQEKLGNKLEVVAEFHRLNVLLMTPTLKDAASRKIATVTLSEARFEGKFGELLK